ncbi:hypothetical protein CBL_00079 [Carabus blaptoides fortunei]
MTILSSYAYRMQQDRKRGHRIFRIIRRVKIQADVNNEVPANELRISETLNLETPSEDTDTWKFARSESSGFDLVSSKTYDQHIMKENNMSSRNLSDVRPNLGSAVQVKSNMTLFPDHKQPHPYDSFFHDQRNVSDKQQMIVIAVGRGQAEGQGEKI